MPLPAIVVGSIAGGFAAALGRFVVKLIAGLGIGTITYLGVAELVATVQSYMVGLLGSAGAVAGPILNVLNVGPAFSMILAAFAARASVGVAKKLVLR